MLSQRTFHNVADDLFRLSMATTKILILSLDIGSDIFLIFNSAKEDDLLTFLGDWYYLLPPDSFMIVIFSNFHHL